MLGFPIHPDVLERLKRMGERKLIVRHVRDPFAKVATDADLGRPDRREAIAEPEMYTCPECGEWTDTEERCCGVGPALEPDLDMER